MTSSYNVMFTFDSEVLIRGAGACVVEGGQVGGVTSTNYVYPIPSSSPILTRDVKTHSHVKAF